MIETDSIFKMPLLEINNQGRGKIVKEIEILGIFETFWLIQGSPIRLAFFLLSQLWSSS